MASRSPTESGPTDGYVRGWVAMTQLMDTGWSWSGHERDVSFLNLKDGTFADVSAVTGLDFEDDGRSVASTDWDGDGDLDMWLRNRSGPQLRFLQNNAGGERHSIAFELSGTTCHRDAIGAVVEVSVGDRRWIRTLMAGDGYLSQSTKRLYFGLGDASRVDRVVVRWPGGDPQTWIDLDAGSCYRLMQGSTAPTSTAFQPFQMDAGPPPPAVSDAARVVLRTPLPLPDTLLSGLFGKSNRPTARLVNLWAQWCGPCIGELKGLAAAHERIDAAKLEIVALSVDKPEKHAAALATFNEVVAGLGEDRRLKFRTADEATMETIDAVLRHLLYKPGETPLPTSLLIDSDGAVQVVYVGPVEMGTLLADVEEYGFKPVPAATRGAYPGRWYFGIRRDFGSLADELRQRGRVDEARFYDALVQPGRDGDASK
ncbi:MAG: redoxin domain-containing protein [Phycisphaerales bacterium]|nr:redoxin domain-containing protein [Phycisphaerales bacterium]